MTVLTHKVMNMDGKEVGSVELDPAIFGARINTSLVHETVRWQRNKKRAGTASTLNRASMTGGGRKPWKQKGSGRARAGTRNSPVWVGGAVAHGPTPRDYTFRLSKRARRQALCSVLTDKLCNESLIILDKIECANGKTKEFRGVLKNLGLDQQKLAFVMPDAEESVFRSAKNLNNVTALPVAGVNVYDLVNRKFLVCTQDGIKALEARLQGKASEESN